MVRPSSAFPLASSGSATECTVSPTLIGARFGVTRTEATPGGMTTMVATPDLPPELAATCALPSATPVTTPLPETVAIDVFSELQKMLGLPVAPATVAWSVVVEPRATVSGFGVMVPVVVPSGTSRVASARQGGRAGERGEEQHESRSTCSTHRALIVARIPRMRACDRARSATLWGVHHNESARPSESGHHGWKCASNGPRPRGAGQRVSGEKRQVTVSCTCKSPAGDNILSPVGDQRK